MADVLDDGEFRLPPRFLADDDLFLEKVEVNDSPPKDLFPLGLPSDLSSPVEFVVGSTETDSDEEDYLVGLTRQMARYTLEDDFGGNHPAFASKNSKDWVFCSSPESSLFAFRSSHGSSSCQSRVSSPSGTWALFCSAAEEAAMVRMNEEPYGGFNNKGLLGPPAKKPSPNRHKSLSLRATQFQQVQQNQLMKQNNPGVWGGKKQRHQQHLVHQNNTNRPPGLFPSAWPPLQQQQPQPPKESGMRAVFLDSSTGKRECAGTGVFLPRRNGTAEPRKKQVCPTVLLPARVVDALNLNLDEINAQPHLRSRFKASVTTDSGAGSRLRSGGNKFREQEGISHEIRLPQEWTY
ncbi:Adenine nucleotide alpha hydrolases-like superfamily protein isoform 1 [Hibiscus syriacus]|uniref:Adenine nucleotide alpha hydrolases-like superfamily protein isoform 1 n=1 Tax=Hibiscus syriacus TaxID=106335 RepID=A0A6A2YKD3_HIBSY|nr:uncharacterized protein LOC120162659 [Hibiscus syriacus]KAE8678557.1 Adenine nucleotide alpha hydrolases-like superfamily protein isoform 1 [Hibiscus syriacus]